MVTMVLNKKWNSRFKRRYNVIATKVAHQKEWWEIVDCFSWCYHPTVRLYAEAVFCEMEDIVNSRLITKLKPRSHLAEYFQIVYDRDNLKPFGTVIVSVENKWVSSIYKTYWTFCVFLENWSHFVFLNPQNVLDSFLKFPNNVLE